MPDGRFKALESELRAAGVRASVAERLVGEIENHVHDLAADLVAGGASETAALEKAYERIGTPDSIVASAELQADLLCWWRRFPRAALVVYPLACVAALPAVPVISGVRHAALIGRWLSCLLAGGIVTVTIFLSLKLAIGV